MPCIGKTQWLENKFEVKLQELMQDYRTNLQHGSLHSTKDMNTAMCAFLHLELKLFIKLKNFYTTQVGALPYEQVNAIAQAIRKEFPIIKFEVILMQLFDACMASPKTINHKKVSKKCKVKYDYIQKMLTQMCPAEAMFSLGDSKCGKSTFVRPPN